MASVFTDTSFSLLMAEVRAESNCVEQSALLFRSSRLLMETRGVRFRNGVMYCPQSVCVCVCVCVCVLCGTSEHLHH